jgi:chromosome segregation ATPase
MSPEARAAYAQIESGVRSLGRSMQEIRRGLHSAERKIEADARARIRLLRREARAQMATLQARRREVTKTLRGLATAAGGSWEDVKRTADSILTESKAGASSVIERFRQALKQATGAGVPVSSCGCPRTRRRAGA